METYLKLPDGSILTYDIWSSIGSGVAAGGASFPQRIRGWRPVHFPHCFSTDYELGPAFLLQNGQGFYIGSNGKTALYNPSTNSWKAGPSMPDERLGMFRHRIARRQRDFCRHGPECQRAV